MYASDAVRLLGPEVGSLDEHIGGGGGRGRDAAVLLGPAETVNEVDASGLRGRGGAGFPTGRKWRAIARYDSDIRPPAVVVNAAEGEPGTFKDRSLLRTNPYQVLEGALIAAFAIDADRVIVATKSSFTREIERLRAAAAELDRAGWFDGVMVEVFEGPGEYLYGEETGLLEVLDGREPFPRVAPPFRHGVDEIGEGGESAADIEMADPDPSTGAAPTLVNNVETFANVPLVLAEGPSWYRSVGTDESPGTVVCTITGRTRRHGVGEVPLGTPLRDVIEEIGDGPNPGREIVAVMSGVANALLPADRLDTPVSYEAMTAAGSGLGAAGFIVFDDETDLVAVAHGVARFLSVESCGQCTPCKQDGLAIAAALDRMRTSDPDPDDLETLRRRVRTVTDGARCYLAQQQQDVIGSILALFPDAITDHAGATAAPADVAPIAPLVDIVDGSAILDLDELRKQPDWTYDEPWSGESPADRIDQRAE